MDPSPAVASSDNQDVTHLRQRVGLYILVMLIIELSSHVSDHLAPLLMADYEVPEVTPGFIYLRWAVTPLFLLCWAFVKLGRPGRSVLIVFESGVTIGLVFLYMYMGMGYFRHAHPSYGPLFTMMGIALLLVVRASLVPSPVHRTVLIGFLAVVYLFVGSRDALARLDPIVTDALIFVGMAFVIATAATSHVIYGLRRQVRAAQRLGQYELGRKLGEGGMGVVYEATHVMLRRPTAVKLLPVEKSSEQTVARFEQEVRQTSRLEHPNSVSIYDYGRTPDGQFYYAMEYVDGVTLGQLVRLDGPIPPARVAAILGQASDALAEAHSMGLVHRDIKPANVMLCERARVPDTVKVLDFGLVKTIDAPADSNDITQGGDIVGTPHYLSPEAIAHPDDVGPASDVYGLGAVGFFLLTGRELFEGRSLVDVCAKHLHVAPESPSAVRGEAIDPGLEALILRCVAKAPEDRPADGARLAVALDELQLDGWTADDARAWWRDLPARRGERRDDVSMARTPTQLAVNLEGRR